MIDHMGSEIRILADLVFDHEIGEMVGPVVSLRVEKPRKIAENGTGTAFRRTRGAI